jgi:hypothetical protein
VSTLTVADLTAEHRGWCVKVPDPDPVLRRREFQIVDVRHWTNDDGAQVGICTTEGRDRGWAGTERQYPADTPGRADPQATDQEKGPAVIREVVTARLRARLALCADAVQRWLDDPGNAALVALYMVYAYWVVTVGFLLFAVFLPYLPYWLGATK